MNPRLRNILILILILAIVLLVVFWFLLRSKNEKQVIIPQDNLDNNITNLENNSLNNLETETEDTETDSGITVAPIKTVSEEEKLKSQLRKLAISFTERYGSFSNSSDYENLEDLLQFMTSDLKNKTQNFIDSKRRANEDNLIYYGMTTRALNTKILEFDVNLNRVIFEVSCQKQEVFGTAINSNTFYSSAEVKFEKSGGVWKVDEFSWK